jgi:hypothetical protein
VCVCVCVCVFVRVCVSEGCSSVYHIPNTSVESRAVEGVRKAVVALWILLYV